MLGKKEKRVILEWLLKKHGLKRKIDCQEVEDDDGKKAWLINVYPKDGWLDGQNLFTESNGVFMCIGVKGPMYSRAKILECMLERMQYHDCGIFLDWRCGKMLIEKGETLESLAIKFELDNGTWRKAR